MIVGCGAAGRQAADTAKFAMEGVKCAPIVLAMSYSLGRFQKAMLSIIFAGFVIV